MIKIKKNLIVSVLVVVALLQACTSDENNSTSSAGDTTGDGISLSKANEIIVDDDNTNLDQIFSVRVVDGGAALEGAVVTITLTPSFFNKGEWVNVADVFTLQNFQRCTEVTGNENGNGILDPAGQANIAPTPGEDDAQLTPTVSGAGVTKTLATNDKGEGYFSIRYGRAAAGWVAFTVTASVSLDGQTLSATEPDFVPLQLASVFDDASIAFSGQQSPFGAAGTCADFN